MKSYTLKEFIEAERPDGKGHIAVNGNDISFDEVLCDVCNKVIVQPENDPDKKVIWIEDTWGLCEECKDKPKKKYKDEFVEEVEDKDVKGGWKANIKVPFDDKEFTEKLKGEYDLRRMMGVFVNKSLVDGLKKGWYKFKDSSMTVERYITLSDDERERYPVGLTELGRKEGDYGDYTNNVLKFLEDKQMYDSLFRKFDIDNKGNVRIELTDIGQKYKMLYEISGIDFSDFIHRKMRFGIRRLFSEFVVIDKNEKMLRGQTRISRR